MEPKSCEENSISKVRPEDFIISSWRRVVPFARTTLLLSKYHRLQR